MATRTGFTKLGVENVGALMTRGVLIDVAALKGVAMLPDTYEITVDDLQQALKRQKLTLQPGDAVIVNTGWGSLWDKDDARYLKTTPGHDRRRRVACEAGSDAGWRRQRASRRDAGSRSESGNPVHQITLVVNGIHLLENLKLDELAGKEVYEFALIVQPLKIQGGTGSTVAPIAVR